MEIGNWWQWLKDYDVPNWFVIFVWPLVLYYWSKRKVRAIPGFDVNPTIGGKQAIGSQQYDVVNFIFANLTGSIVYVRDMRLKERQDNFPIPPAAVKSTVGWRELKFLDQNNNFTYDQIILGTGQRAVTSIAVSRPLGDEFINYRPGRLSRLFKRPRYFVIEYTAMVGEKKYSVASVY